MQLMACELRTHAADAYTNCAGCRRQRTLAPLHPCSAAACAAACGVAANRGRMRRRQRMGAGRAAHLARQRVRVQRRSALRRHRQRLRAGRQGASRRCISRQPSLPPRRRRRACPPTAAAARSARHWLSSMYAHHQGQSSHPGCSAPTSIRKPPPEGRHCDMQRAPRQHQRPHRYHHTGVRRARGARGRARGAGGRRALALRACLSAGRPTGATACSARARRRASCATWSRSRSLSSCCPPKCTVPLRWSIWTCAPRRARARQRRRPCGAASSAPACAAGTRRCRSRHR